MAFLMKQLMRTNFQPQRSSSIRKIVYNLSGFNKYGLHHDDCLDDDDPVVKEALRRAPQKIIDERNFRLLRAIQVSIRHEYLPENEWTTFENDKRYLQPFIDEVQEEEEEKRQFN